MAKVKQIIFNPITWIAVCLVVMVAAIVGVTVSCISVTMLGGYSDKFSLSFIDLLSSKNVDYSVYFSYSFTYLTDSAIGSTSGVSSITVSNSDWSQLTYINIVYVFAFITVAMAVISLVFQVANKFVKNEKVNEVLLVSNTVVCFALLVFGLLTLGSVVMFGFASNINNVMINSSVQTSAQEAFETLRDEWFNEQLGMTYAEASKVGEVSSDFAIYTSASRSIAVGSVILGLAGIFGGIFGIEVSAAKVHKLI